MMYNISLTTIELARTLTCISTAAKHLPHYEAEALRDLAKVIESQTTPLAQEGE